ncbi:MAG: tetratricopeptide repeat protein [Chloroherpetonaceae bacterium]|nr:tetratricopeptide repeat protein [Chloroherpetonaceae bacterium]MDW8437299.1 tetratricopeptide repeat protein [Chloroherpetonaceae bacterium]
MKPSARLFATLSMALFSLVATAQTPSGQAFTKYDDQVLKGIDYVYNLDFEEADALFDDIVRKDPKSPVGHFFKGMVLWWKMMLDLDDTRYDERFSDYMQTVIDLCDERLEVNDRDLEAMFFKSGALGFRGRLRANRGQWLKAALDGKDALPIVSRIQKVGKGNMDVLFGLGIYDYYAEAIPEQYPAVRPLALMFPKGDKKRGIARLDSCMRFGHYAKVEAIYFLTQIYYVYEKDFAKATEFAKMLHERYPDNPFFYSYLGRCYAASGYWKEAEEIFTDIWKKHQRGAKHYNDRHLREAHYYIGMALMNRRDLKDAFAHFTNAVNLSIKVDAKEPSAFRVLSELRLGMIYDAQGERAKAIAHYKKVLDMKEHQDSHAKAKMYLKHPYSG